MGILPLVAVVDYGMGNLYSVKRACEYAGIEACITSDAHVLARADGVILPGVGAFGDAMETLRAHGLVAAMKDSIRSGKPLLGICLGMQLLMSNSEEFGLYAGLDVFKGRVVKFPVRNALGEPLKVPQVGWNTISQAGESWRTPLLQGISEGAFMYFVHSLRVIPASEEWVVSRTTYEGVTYASGIARENVAAFQFHPEKSGLVGIRIYQNFARLLGAAANSLV